jgi:MoaA/NifB/PqqE/SkfB family radical SAM enzyme
LLGLVSNEEIELCVRSTTDGRVVTMVINNACNLACKHCYLQVERLTGAELSSAERARVFRSAFDLNPSLICLSGKEIFLGKQGEEALKQLTQIKRELRSATRLGAITNGTLIHRHRDAILAADLDNLDISVDGVETDHDHNRGAGAFAAMRPNLEWVVRELGDRVFVNMTLQQRNFRSLIPAVDQFHKMGVRTVGCGFYSPQPYTDPTLRLNEDDYDDIFRILGGLSTLSPKHPLTVLVEVDILCLPAMLAFMRSDWFAPDAIKIDERADYYNEFVLDNGIRLQVRFSPFPQLIFKSGRVTAEGNYLTAEDTVNTRKYAQYSLGNARDYGCDLVALQRSAEQSQRIRDLFDDYFGRILPQLQEAYAERLTESLPSRAETPVLSL